MAHATVLQQQETAAQRNARVLARHSDLLVADRQGNPIMRLKPEAREALKKLHGKCMAWPGHADMEYDRASALTNANNSLRIPNALGYVMYISGLTFVASIIGVPAIIAGATITGMIMLAIGFVGGILAAFSRKTENTDRFLNEIDYMGDRIRYAMTPKQQ